MSGAYRSGDQVMARFKGEWFKAEIIRLEPEGDYLVRWLTTPNGRPERWSKAEERPPVSVIEPEDIRPNMKTRGAFSGF